MWEVRGEAGDVCVGREGGREGGREEEVVGVEDCCWLCLMDMRIIRLLGVGSAGGKLAMCI